MHLNFIELDVRWALILVFLPLALRVAFDSQLEGQPRDHGNENGKDGSPGIEQVGGWFVGNKDVADPVQVCRLRYGIDVRRYVIPR